MFGAMRRSIRSLDIASTGGKKTLFPVSPFSHRADVRVEQANESDERSLARALNVAVSHRSLPLSDADREAF